MNTKKQLAAMAAVYPRPVDPNLMAQGALRKPRQPTKSEIIQGLPMSTPAVVIEAIQMGPMDDDELMLSPAHHKQQSWLLGQMRD